MAIQHSKALSAVGIVGIMCMIYETMVGTGVWAMDIAHVNFDATEDSVDYAVVSATPQMQKWIGGRDAKRLFAQAVTLVSEDYEATVVDLKKNWMYDKTGQLMRRVENFVGKTFSHWNKLASEVLELGTATLTYDGANFFSTSHSFGDSGTISNNVSNSEVAALDVASTAAVTTAEAADIIYGLLHHFHTFKDDAGEPIHEDLQSIIVMVPTAMGSAFRQAAQAQIVTDGVGSRDNPLARDGVRVRVIVNARLTSSTVLYAFADNGDPALILQQRGMPMFSDKAEGSDFEHDTNQWEFGVTSERAVGLFCWQAAIRATIS